MRAIPAPKSHALEMKQMLCRSINPTFDEKLKQTNLIHGKLIILGQNHGLIPWEKSNFAFM